MRKALERLNKALALSESGQHAAVVDFLSESPRQEIEQSPTLTLLLGTAHARLGQHSEGQRYIDIALERARSAGDQTVELRALNAQGAIALVRGRINEAEDSLTSGLEAAKRAGDDAAVGRCANNLGIIAHYRGDYTKALDWYSIASAALQQVQARQGMVEVDHNIGITYRDQRDLDRALEQARRAVESARELGDRTLGGLALAVQAEIRALAGDARVARREIEIALAAHRELGDEPEVTGDLRILARVLVAEGKSGEAEQTLRDVIDRADSGERPRMATTARRDLAHVLAGLERHQEAIETAQAARVAYNESGAVGEAQRLDDFIESLR